MREVTVYGLRAIGTDQYLYVGATTDMSRRKSAGYTASRVAAALDGLEWEMVGLEQCDLAHSVEREAFWIAKLLREGHALTNTAEPTPLRAGPVAPPRSGGVPGKHANKMVGGIRPASAELAKWDVAAAKAGKTRTDWIHDQLNRAAKPRVCRFVKR